MNIDSFVFVTFLYEPEIGVFVEFKRNKLLNEKGNEKNVEYPLKKIFRLSCNGV